MINNIENCNVDSTYLNIIKKNRYKLKLTQKQVAQKCNVKQHYISQLENFKKVPSINMIMKLSKTLNINPISIFEEFYCKQFKQYRNIIE